MHLRWKIVLLRMHISCHRRVSYAIKDQLPWESQGGRHFSESCFNNRECVAPARNRESLLALRKGLYGKPISFLFHSYQRRRDSVGKAIFVRRKSLLAVCLKKACLLFVKRKLVCFIKETAYWLFEKRKLVCFLYRESLLAFVNGEKC